MKNNKKSFPQLKKLADKLCSQYIRQKYADWKGDVRCYTCDKVFPIKSIQCGHFISRVYTNLRWAEENLRPQCYSCNVMRHGNMDEFAIRLEREKPGTLENLYQWKHRATKMGRADLLFIIEDFEKKLSP